MYRPETDYWQYGTMRVYEFGPETGRRVLLVHGITTPCLSLGSIALELAEKKGCRVLLFVCPPVKYSPSLLLLGARLK